MWRPEEKKAFSWGFDLKHPFLSITVLPEAIGGPGQGPHKLWAAASLLELEVPRGAALWSLGIRGQTRAICISVVQHSLLVRSPLVKVLPVP